MPCSSVQHLLHEALGTTPHRRNRHRPVNGPAGSPRSRTPPAHRRMAPARSAPSRSTWSRWPGSAWSRRISPAIGGKLLDGELGERLLNAENDVSRRRPPRLPPAGLGEGGIDREQVRGLGAVLGVEGDAQDAVRLGIADLERDRVGVVGEVDARLVGESDFRHLLGAVAQRHDARRLAQDQVARAAEQLGAEAAVERGRDDLGGTGCSELSLPIRTWTGITPQPYVTNPDMAFSSRDCFGRNGDEEPRGRALPENNFAVELMIIIAVYQMPSSWRHCPLRAIDAKLA